MSLLNKSNEILFQDTVECKYNIIFKLKPKINFMEIDCIIIIYRYYQN